MQWILVYVIFRSAVFLISSFYPELVGYFSLLNSAEFNIEALNNSFEANMAMLAGPAYDVSSSNEGSVKDFILKTSSADNGSTLGGNGSSENANSNNNGNANSNNNGNANSNNNGNANSNNNVNDRTRRALAWLERILRDTGGVTMNPDRAFSESEIRLFSDNQVRDRMEGLRGLLEDEQNLNDYRRVEHYIEELRKLSSESRRRQEERSAFWQEIERLRGSEGRRGRR